MLWFFASSFLANSAFVLGRNIGPALFMAHVGSEQLTAAMGLSGIVTVAVSPIYTRLSHGYRATTTNKALLMVTIITLMVLYCAAFVTSGSVGSVYDKVRCFNLFVTGGFNLLRAFDPNPNLHRNPNPSLGPNPGPSPDPNPGPNPDPDPDPDPNPNPNSYSNPNSDPNPND